MSHLPVLLNEILDALIPTGHYLARAIDGTLGAGGHTRGLLTRGIGEVLGLDVDEQALAIARDNLREFDNRVHIVHSSYLNMAENARRLGWEQVDGIVLDLGLSSIQLDTPERGFAFRHDGPLDMRFDPTSSCTTASEIVNQWDEKSLAEIFFTYGEEPLARRYAKAIVQHRPFDTTRSLSDMIEQVTPPIKPGQRGSFKIHSATRIFQALRIAVNGELDSVEKALPIAIDLLKSGGRLAVISFHSLEDRIVKRCFADASLEIITPPGMASIQARQPRVRLVYRKPIEASIEERVVNPRSRSAKLRVVEKL